MAVHPASRRLVSGSDPVTPPSASPSHAEQLDLRLNSITVRPVAAKAKLPVTEVAASNKLTVNDLDAQAKAIGVVIAEALRHSGLSQKEASFRMGYADASKLARWIAGEDVSSFVSRFLSVPELRRGFILALAEFARVRVRSVIEIDHEAAG